MYRDTGVDPRIQTLTNAIAREQELRDELAHARFQQDARLREVDELEVKLAKRERGGLFGFGRGSMEALAALAEELRLARLARDMSAAREQQLLAELADVDTARAELADLERTTAHRLRTMGGPLGDELRALADTRDATDRALATVDAALTAGDTALVAVKAVELHLVEISYGGEPFATAIPHARSALFGFAYVAASVISETPVTRATADHARALEHEHPARFANATGMWISQLDSAMSELLSERRRLADMQDVLAAREREIAGEATDNF